jgi:hypothetical protein
VALSAAIAVAAIYFVRDRAYVPAPKTTQQSERVIAAHSAIPSPFIMFRALAPHHAHGRIAMISLASSEPVRHIASLSCVRLHYAGTLVGGTEFDSSYKRGQPATFPVNGVIKGWSEALQLMKAGSKYQLFIPASLAYGERAVGGDIGPNSTLIFEVDLLEVKPPATPVPVATPPKAAPPTSPTPKK